ncbi:MAG: hypothetical protein IJY01_05275 [Clostridia bacterium]|nr:hypothetical protein [Clostridia bacterium]
MHTKNIIKKFLLILLLTALSLMALAGCEGGGASDITLIKGGVAQFKVVYSSAAGASIRRAANDLVEELSDLGVDIGDAVSDTDATEVTDCELILGVDVENRTDDCVIGVDDIGEMGYVIKAVGKRIIIAGGTAEGTKEALETFKEKYLGITEDTDSLSDVSVKGDLLDEFVTSNSIVSFDINGTPIEEFKIVTSYGNEERIKKLCPDPAKLVGAIKGAMEIELEVSDGKPTADGHEIIIRLVDEAGNKGFRAFVDGKDLVVECSYYNLFAKAYDAFISSEIKSKKGEVSLDKNYLFEYDVSCVKYSDFGAKGDGRTDDYKAILETHQFANLCGQKVLADKRASYYIGLTGDVAVPVRTDVDWGDATFTIDDTVAGVYAERGGYIFHLARDEDNVQVDLTADEIKQLAGVSNPKILRTYDQNGKLISGKIPWLTPRLTSGAMLVLKNSNHRDYVRFGGNRNTGETRTEVIVVDKNGNIDPTTPVTFDFEELTSISIIYTDDAPITVEGGRFYNICCLVGAETDYKNVYSSFGRGILVERSNTTIKNLNHKMKNEPKRFVGGKDSLSQSYPYYGFIKHNSTYNSKVIGCDLTGHKVYYQDKSASTGASNVAMGTYDLTVQYSIGSYFERVTQSAVPIHDSAYWGMMASNYSRNMTFKSCSMSRFDAHCGFWNADLIDCEFGLCINVVGGGTLNVIGTTRYTGANFVSLRGDYGATFEGDMLIKDCEFYGASEYNSERGESYDQDALIAETYVVHSSVTNGVYGQGTAFEASYYTWDFGYKCYMPQVITIDNFTYHGEKIAVFNGIVDTHFIKQSNDDEIYEPTKKIIFKNMTDAEIAAIPNCHYPANTPMVAAFPREIVK